jgi:hypothetical protein
MRRDRAELIETLAADLRPVENPGSVAVGVAAWLGFSVVYSVVAIVAAGPLRPGALGNLVEYPAFAGETLLAAAAIVALAYAAARSAVPGEPRGYLRWALVLLVAWIGVYVVGLWHPAHPVSTLGARPYCIWETVAFGLPTLGLMLWLARRQYPLWPRMTGALAGVTAAAIPAAVMQFACQYVPAHILTYHMSPILVTAAIGAVIAPVILCRRTSAADSEARRPK